MKLKKYDNDLDEAYYQGDATLADAEFTITNLSDKPVTVANSLSESGSAKKVAKNGVVGIITTNADGLAQTNAKALPYGTYYIEETKPSLGYKKDTTWGFTVRYREDGIYLKAKNESNFKKDGEFITFKAGRKSRINAPGILGPETQETGFDTDIDDQDIDDYNIGQ